MDVLNSNKVIDTDVYTWRCHQLGIGIPLIIVPPHAGRDWTIAENIIKVCMETGRTVVSFELKSATYATNDTSVMDLIDAISAIYAWLDVPQIDLVGLCQGGWTSTIWNAKYPERVRKMAIFVAPISTDCAPYNLIEEYMRRPYVLEIQKFICMVNGGLQLGLLQWMSFSMVDPEAIYWTRFSNRNKLLAAGDTIGLAKWDKQNAWYDNRLDLAGNWFLDALENHFRDNRLYEGTWNVGGSLVDCSRIENPVYAFGGRTDPITDANQCFAICDIVSGSCIKTMLEGGHTAGWTGKAGLKIFREMFL